MGKRAPLLFVGHGSPMNAIEDSPVRAEWKRMGQTLGKPKAILGISAHWMTDVVGVRRAADTPQQYDMYGFPRALYAIKYAPHGDVALADKALQLLPGSVEDNTWGMDHGLWSVLCNMYPEADVPVALVSVNNFAAPAAQFEVGRKLKALREEGIMILCSGNVVHNLHRVDWDMPGGHPWADQFDAEVQTLIRHREFDKVVAYEQIDNHRLAIPTTDHFYPLLIALGAVDEDDTLTVWANYRELGSMSMTSYLFQ